MIYLQDFKNTHNIRLFIHHPPDTIFDREFIEMIASTMEYDWLDSISYTQAKIDCFFTYEAQLAIPFDNELL